MQILIQPMYSKQELNADSNYVVMTALIRAMLTVRPDFHFVLPFPDSKSGYKYADDGFFRLPNVTRIPQRISPQKMTNAVSFDGVWFNELFRRYGFEVVWVNLVESVAAISRSGDNTYEPAARSFLCAAHNYVIHDSLPYPFDQLRNVASHQVIGALNADVNVFNSRHCKWMFFDTARHWLNDETLRAIDEKSVFINYGTLEDELQFAPPDNEIPIIAYNHRLQAYKNYKVTFALLQELWDEGHRFKVRFMNNTSENMSEITNYPFMETRLTSTRSEYLDALRGCDLNITNSQHETFCIAAIESMALGQPLIAPNKVTFPEIVGNLDTPTHGVSYPYLFDSRDEEKAHILKLLTDVSERRKWGAYLSQYVRSHFNSTLWAERYAALWEANAYPKLGVKPDAKDMVERILRQNSGADMEKMRSLIYAQHVNGRHPLSNQSLPATKLVRLVHELGGMVKMEGGSQRLYLA